MRGFTISMTLLLLAFVAFGQQTAGLQFDVADFNKKFEVAAWLVRYDQVAWKTTDVLLKKDKSELEKLGAEWFCFEDESGVWHAVYGKYADGKYDLAFHYKFDKDAKITETNEKIDTVFLNLHARALVTANQKQLAAIKDRDVPRFNQYIRQNKDKTFNVWLFPAFQTNGTAVYGGESIYTIDESGTKITKDESYYQREFKGFRATPPREIWLNYRELEKPSLGSIFFVWYYKEYFTKIFIDNSKSTSTVVKEGDEYIWVHAEKRSF